MSRLLIDDPTKQDNRALLNTAKIAAIFDITAITSQYITCTGDAEITIAEGTVVSVGGAVFKTVTTVLNATNLDSGTAFSVGRDYYVYICDPGSGGDDVYKISLNSTYPAGYTATTSRKIGGFHFGVVRRVSSNNIPIDATGAEWGTGWEANVYNGILPRSVWTLKHRPKCQPEGMVYVSGGLWVDIYLSSNDGAGGLKSTYASTPMTGTEGMNQYTFNERAMNVGKRLLSYSEWCRVAFGSPQGLAGDNTNAWTAGSGRNTTGGVLRAVSSIGARDCVGNVWEWLDEFITNASGRVLSGTTNPTSYTYTDGGRSGQVITNGSGHGPTTSNDNSAPPQGAWGWDRISPFPGYGNIHEYYDQSLIALVAGGYWGNGANAGARAVGLDNYPWYVAAYIGVRLGCDSL